MTRKFAIVKNNKIDNITLGLQDYQPEAPLYAIDVTEMSPQPHIGYDVINGEIQFPQVPSFEERINASNFSSERKSLLITKINNKETFTEDELTDIDLIFLGQ